MSAALYIDLVKTSFRPNETVKGKLLWALEKKPKTIELTLSWRTQGSGTEDSMIEHELSWSPSHASGEQPFEFTLPAEPYSIKGRLISIKWELELRAHRVKAPFIQELIVSPIDQCIQLAHVRD